MNLRMKAESSVASAEEKASVLERKLNHISESIERDKKRLHNEIEQLKRESKLSVSRISADVSRNNFSSNFQGLCMNIYYCLTCLILLFEAGKNGMQS